MKGNGQWSFHVNKTQVVLPISALLERRWTSGDPGLRWSRGLRAARADLVDFTKVPPV